jgi:CheY-like chemotaxis protein
MRDQLKCIITKLLNNCKISFEIIEGTDGSDIINSYKNKNQQFNIIFTDEKMLEVDGSQAITYIRRNEEKYGEKNVPIISVTGEEETNHIKNNGATFVLKKPALKKDIENILQIYTQNIDV